MSQTDALKLSLRNSHTENGEGVHVKVKWQTSAHIAEKWWWEEPDGEL